MASLSAGRCSVFRARCTCPWPRLSVLRARLCTLPPADGRRRRRSSGSVPARATVVAIKLNLPPDCKIVRKRPKTLVKGGAWSPNVMTEVRLGDDERAGRFRPRPHPWRGGRILLSARASGGVAKQNKVPCSSRRTSLASWSSFSWKRVLPCIWNRIYGFFFLEENGYKA
jgi:hypothetical protein